MYDLGSCVAARRGPTGPQAHSGPLGGSALASTGTVQAQYRPVALSGQSCGGGEWSVLLPAPADPLTSEGIHERFNLGTAGKVHSFNQN